MIREFLIKLLFRLLDDDKQITGVDNERINQWLIRQYSDMGFREYFRKRDIQLLKTMGVGLDQNSYKLWLGQRFELLRTLQKVDMAYKQTKPKTGASVREDNKKIGEQEQG
ncbi:hypothetical protein M0R01_04475 [bacterium]|jgi:hypothetical protein|nr:hypothetical protein [bacterium]